VLHYQPQIDARSGLVCAAEALVRWQHPRQGMLLRPRSSPSPRKAALIDAIGSWVLKEACLQQQRWRRKAFRSPASRSTCPPGSCSGRISCAPCTT